jgi:hypothetical protein
MCANGFPEHIPDWSHMDMDLLWDHKTTVYE